MKLSYTIVGLDFIQTLPKHDSISLELFGSHKLANVLLPVVKRKDTMVPFVMNLFISYVSFVFVLVFSHYYPLLLFLVVAVFVLHFRNVYFDGWENILFYVVEF